MKSTFKKIIISNDQNENGFDEVFGILLEDSDNLENQYHNMIFPISENRNYQESWSGNKNEPLTIPKVVDNILVEVVDMDIHEKNWYLEMVSVNKDFEKSFKGLREIIQFVYSICY